MKVPLRDQQRQAIDRAGRLPLEITDANTDQVFYLISGEQYHRARPVLEGIEDIDPSLYEVENIQPADDR